MTRYKKKYTGCFFTHFQCPKKTFDRPSESMENYSQDHFKNFQDIPSPWKQSLKKCGVAKEIFTVLVPTCKDAFHVGPNTAYWNKTLQ